MFLPTTLNFYLYVFSSQETKRFGDDFPQLSNDYLPAKNSPPLAIKLVYQNYYFFLTLPLSI